MDNLKNRFSQEILQFLFFKIMVTKKTRKKQKREHNDVKRFFLSKMVKELYKLMQYSRILPFWENKEKNIFT